MFSAPLGQSETGVFGSLESEPEPLEEKKQEPKPLGKKSQEPELLKNKPAPQPVPFSLY